MAKIHILHVSMNQSDPPRTGVVHCLYHVNISASKNPLVDVSSGVSYHVSKGNIAGTVTLGTSRLDLSASTHPDFGGTTEDTLLSNQDIAELHIPIDFTEGDDAGGIATRVDSLFNNVENYINAEYTQLYQWYGIERNPA